jgi:protein-S-isoprenylcysteine O-methyltransferase Ste14
VSAWRHVRAAVLLPGTVTVVVPAVILLTGDGPRVRWWGVVVAVPLIGAGVWLWARTVRLFAQIGQGTLAPWDPTRHLVVEGPYGVVRNPMITAVLAVLLGEAALFGSLGLLLWGAGFFVVNHAWFRFYEEPGLEERFGEEYRAYKAEVPRWLPW